MFKKIIFVLVVALALTGCNSTKDPKPNPPVTPVPTGIEFLVETGNQSEVVKALMSEVQKQGGLKTVMLEENAKPGFNTIRVDGTDKELRVAKAAYAALVAASLPSNEAPAVDVEEIRRISDKIFDIYLKALEVLDLIAIISEDDGVIKLKNDIKTIGNKVIVAVHALLLILEEVEDES